jgi:hypothetical protein
MICDAALVEKCAAEIQLILDNKKVPRPFRYLQLRKQKSLETYCLIIEIE